MKKGIALILAIIAAMMMMWSMANASRDDNVYYVKNGESKISSSYEDPEYCFNMCFGRCVTDPSMTPSTCKAECDAECA
ncbi:uncharacterized protein G2W53_011564 [Senna tora]|uniref:Uncharacterized protein n=1 Tax=Senna tora TaxID=362788 RepID=A0A834X1I0_9FABA|nr:uncharacterized protein G2W53_011564 [Senna tora]